MIKMHEPMAVDKFARAITKLFFVGDAMRDL